MILLNFHKPLQFHFRKILLLIFLIGNIQGYSHVSEKSNENNNNFVFSINFNTYTYGHKVEFTTVHLGSYEKNMNATINQPLRMLESPKFQLGFGMGFSYRKNAPEISNNLKNETHTNILTQNPNFTTLSKNHWNYYPQGYASSNQQLNYINTGHKSGKTPTKFGMGFPIQYQMAFYTGAISNHITSHSAIYIPGMALDFWYRRFIFQYSISVGNFKSNTTVINGDVIYGPFYGYIDLIHNVNFGYKVINNNSFSIVPNLGMAGSLNYLYTKSTIKNKNIGVMIKSFTVGYYTVGLMFDYKVIYIDKINDSYLALRLKYDLGFPTKYTSHIVDDGIIHQISIGIVANIRFMKDRY